VRLPGAAAVQAARPDQRQAGGRKRPGQAGPGARALRRQGDPARRHDPVHAAGDHGPEQAGGQRPGRELVPGREHRLHQPPARQPEGPAVRLHQPGLREGCPRPALLRSVEPRPPDLVVPEPGMVAGQLLPAMTRPLRVLHCPEVVGGMPGELAGAERALGADSRAVAFENSVYDYPIDEVLFSPETGRLTREWKRWGLLRRALQFDVVHFNFGRTIMPDRTTELPGRGRLGMLVRRLYAGVFELRDVALLKRLGKAV